MEIHQLRYLSAVVKSGSVTTAAEAQFVSQPSVSKQLRLLEKELGVALFHRVGRRLLPTEAGLALADCADRIFDDLAGTIAQVSGPESLLGGTLRMCATETVVDHLLPSALAELMHSYPNSHVSVEMLSTDDAVSEVLANEMDLAIVALPLADSRLEVHPLLEEEVLLALPPEHAWAGRTSVSMAEVLEEPGLLLSMSGHGLRALVDEVSQQLGIFLAQRLELRSQASLLSMVAIGAGIAFAPRLAVAQRQDVVAVQVMPRLSRQIGWVKRRGRHLPAIGSELLRILASPPALAVDR